MIEEPAVQFTIALDDPQLDPEEQQEIVQSLLNQLSNLDEVEWVERTENLSPTQGGKPGIEFLVGMLTAEVTWKNTKAFLGFLGDRLSDKPIKLKVKVSDTETEIEIEARSRQELLEAKKQVDELVKSARSKSNG